MFVAFGTPVFEINRMQYTCQSMHKMESLHLLVHTEIMSTVIAYVQLTTPVSHTLMGLHLQM